MHIFSILVCSILFAVGLLTSLASMWMQLVYELAVFCYSLRGGDFLKGPKFVTWWHFQGGSVTNKATKVVLLCSLGLVMLSPLICLTSGPLDAMVMMLFTSAMALPCTFVVVRRYLLTI